MWHHRTESESQNHNDHCRSHDRTLLSCTTSYWFFLQVEDLRVCRQCFEKDERGYCPLFDASRKHQLALTENSSLGGVFARIHIPNALNFHALTGSFLTRNVELSSWGIQVRCRIKSRTGWVIIHACSEGLLCTEMLIFNRLGVWDSHLDILIFSASAGGCSFHMSRPQVTLVGWGLDYWLAEVLITGWLLRHT